MRKRRFVFINSNVNTQGKMCDVKVSTSKGQSLLFTCDSHCCKTLKKKLAMLNLLVEFVDEHNIISLFYLLHRHHKTQNLHAISWWFIPKHRRNERCDTKIRAHVILICRYFYIVYSSIRNHYLRLYSCDRSKRHVTMTTIIALLFITSQINGKTSIA